MAPAGSQHALQVVGQRVVPPRQECGRACGVERGTFPRDATMVCTVTGHGLKDPQWALKTADGAEVTPVRVPVDAYSVARALGLEG